MKTAFTSLSLTAVLIAGISESKASELFLKINRSGQHSVLVNDQYQTNSNNTYRFFDLGSGPASVKVSDAGSGAAVFTGTVQLNFNERVVAEMSADGNITIVTAFTVTYSNWYTQSGQNNTGGYGNNNGGNNNGGNNNGGYNGGNNGGNNNGGNNNGGYHGGGHNHGGNNNPPPVCGVSTEKFNEIVSAIKAQSVESYKLDKAKSIVKKNTLSSNQVAEVCKLFTVESYKLDFAKFAYDYTADKDNYFVVGKVFDVPSYSRDLDKYIDSKH